MGGRLQVLQAVLDPLHRPAQHLARMRDDGLLRVGARLGAEAASHVLADHPDGLLGQPEQAREILPRVVVRLRRQPCRQRPPLRIEIGDGTARLERHGRLPNEPEPAPTRDGRTSAAPAPPRPCGARIRQRRFHSIADTAGSPPQPWRFRCRRSPGRAGTRPRPTVRSPRHDSGRAPPRTRLVRRRSGPDRRRGIWEVRCGCSDACSARSTAGR
jgi:hypothetical protein